MKSKVEMWNILPTLSNTIKNQTLLSCVSIVLKPKIESREEGILLTITLLGLPWQLTWERIRLQCRRPRFNSWVRKILWRRDRLHTPVSLGFPGGSDSKEPPAKRETWVQSLGWEAPWEEGIATHSSILAWRICLDRGAWWAIFHGVAKNRTWLSN